MIFSRTSIFLFLVTTLGVAAVACSDSDSGGGATTPIPTNDGGGSGTDGGGNNGNDGGGTTDECVASGSATDILSGVEGPIGRAAVDDQFVYVPGKLTGGEGVQRIPRAGGAGTPLATSALQNVVADLAVIAGGDVYFVGASSGKIYKAPTAGGAATYTEVATGYEFFSLRRLVADADSLYVLAYKGGSPVIDRIPLAGGAPQNVATLANGQYNLALQGSDVWFSGGAIADTAVRHVPKSGGTPESAVTGRQCLNGLAVTADTIFCADTNVLSKMPRAGGTATPLYTTPGSQIDRLENAVVSEDGAVAYVADAMQHPNERGGRILRIDVATGTTTALACNVQPLEQLALGPNALVASGSFVGVTDDQADVKLLPR